MLGDILFELLGMGLNLGEHLKKVIIVCVYLIDDNYRFYSSYMKKQIDF